jgi:CheY-like chemotaxis protein
VNHLALVVWRCTDCQTQFTTHADGGNFERARKARRLVLNVDDRAPALYTRNRLLRELGFTVVDAATSAEARAQALRLQPNAVLLDVHLPDGDGRELCRELRAEPSLSETIIILLSATLPAGARMDAVEAGAAAYFREPVTAAALGAALRDAMGPARGPSSR